LAVPVLLTVPVLVLTVPVLILTVLVLTVLVLILTVSVLVLLSGLILHLLLGVLIIIFPLISHTCDPDTPVPRARLPWPRPVVAIYKVEGFVLFLRVIIIDLRVDVLIDLVVPLIIDLIIYLVVILVIDLVIILVIDLVVNLVIIVVDRVIGLLVLVDRLIRLILIGLRIGSAVRVLDIPGNVSSYLLRACSIRILKLLAVLRIRRGIMRHSLNRRIPHVLSKERVELSVIHNLPI
jgi:hypothetical protein